MPREIERLISFNNWYFQNSSPEEMASLGFRQVAQNTVRCEYCKKIKQCQEGKLGLKIHFDLGVGCAFLLNYKELKSKSTWCDWSKCLLMDVPENRMDIIWREAITLGDNAININGKHTVLSNGA